MLSILTKKEVFMDEIKIPKIREAIGLYTIKELVSAFDISRYSIDKAIKTGKLPYRTANNQKRFIFLTDFVASMDVKNINMQNKALN